MSKTIECEVSITRCGRGASPTLGVSFGDSPAEPPVQRQIKSEDPGPAFLSVRTPLGYGVRRV